MVGGERLAISFVGVRFEIGNENAGVIYALSNRRQAFNAEDINTLDELKHCASSALACAQYLLQPIQKIEQNLKRINDYRDLLKNSVATLRGKMGAQAPALIAIHLKDEWNKMVQTVYGEGSAEDWPKRFRHPIRDEPELRDIHVDIIMKNSPGFEVICGWDDRFNPWIFHQCRHNEILRAFITIVLFYDRHDRIVNPSDINLEFESKLFSSRDEDQGEGEGIRVDAIVREETDLRPETIGTLEIGYPLKLDGDKGQQMERMVRMAKENFNHFLELALDTHISSVDYVLADVLRPFMSMCAAHSASIYLDGIVESKKFRYVAGAGGVGSKLASYPPRGKDGLGVAALASNKPVSGTHSSHIRKEAIKLGVKSAVAFPIRHGNKIGLAYLYFMAHRRLSDMEKQWVVILLNRAVGTVLQEASSIEIRNQIEDFDVVRKIFAEIIARSAKNSFLRDIGWSALNMLAADVITIYETSDSGLSTDLKENFTIVGRTFEAPVERQNIYRLTAPDIMRNQTKPVWASDSIVGHAVFDNPERDRVSANARSFVDREKIVSVVGLPLRIGDENVGVMFVNFRAEQLFRESQRQIIEYVALSVALAIKIRRAVIGSESMSLFKFMTLGILHDLNNISTWFDELISKSLSGSSEERRIAELEISPRINRVVNELRALQPVTPTETDIEKCIDSAIARSILSDTTNEKSEVFDGEIIIARELEVPTVFGNEDALIYIFGELILNAYQAWRLYPERRLSIYFEVMQESENWLCIRISDDGPGIDCEKLKIQESELSRIFDKDVSTGSRENNGMGLWVCRAQIDRMGGAINVEKNAARGTTFTIRLRSYYFQVEHNDHE